MKCAITTNPSNEFKKPLSRIGLIGYLRSLGKIIGSESLLKSENEKTVGMGFSRPSFLGSKGS